MVGTAAFWMSVMLRSNRFHLNSCCYQQAQTISSSLGCRVLRSHLRPTPLRDSRCTFRCKAARLRIDPLGVSLNSLDAHSTIADWSCYFANRPALGAALAKLKQVLYALFVKLCKELCSHFCCTLMVSIPMRTDYCITIAGVSSLSLSRSPKGSASLAFQRSSQSEEIYTCPNITFNMCEVR